jgi:hypothetical protein
VKGFFVGDFATTLSDNRWRGTLRRHGCGEAPGARIFNFGTKVSATIGALCFVVILLMFRLMAARWFGLPNIDWLPR